MRQLGVYLGLELTPSIPMDDSDICVICTVEDADFLAQGVIEGLEEKGFGARVRLVCLWNERVAMEPLSVAPVIKEYREQFDQTRSLFIIVKSIISGACVVKTNIARMLSNATPRKVFVVSPVMLAGAEKRLADEFPASVSDGFSFVHFATDTDKKPGSEEVVPGVGGSVYELLGLGDQYSKNSYLPHIVQERRRARFKELA